MMISGCALLVLPALLLSGCDKEKNKSPEEAFEAYVGGNMLFDLMEPDKHALLVSGVRANPRELKYMIKEAVQMLQLMIAIEGPRAAFDLSKVRAYIDNHGNLKGSAPAAIDDVSMLNALALLVEEFAFDLMQDPELQMDEGQLSRRLRRTLSTATSEITGMPLAMYAQGLCISRSHDVALKIMLHDFKMRGSSAQREHQPEANQRPPLVNAPSPAFLAAKHTQPRQNGQVRT